MSHPNKPIKVALWIRFLALLYLACVAFAILVLVQRVLQGQTVSLPGLSEDLLGSLLFAYMSLLFFYVAVTGWVPVRYFPIGAVTWPYLRDRVLRSEQRKQ
jgi:hypothetical protein